MQENTNISSRLQKMLDYLGLNAAEFAKKLDYNRPQTIYDILNGKAKPSFDFFHKLENSEYSDVFEYKWVIGGKGEMLKQDLVITPMNINRKTKDAVIDTQEVPLYDFTAVAGLRELFDSGAPQKTLQTIKIPNLPKCDGAVPMTGDSMYPLLKSGDLILYKEINVSDIFYGEMYLLSIILSGQFKEYVTVKYIQKSDLGDDYIKLVSQNHHHQPKDFKVSDVSAIALIKASVRYNTMS
ncbi:transcriptional regulator with XRE-family HTH domain [Chryseobacterium defluvii]|uniref:Transcriptional regulator with XRE-family HTH domain n=1 Tax=Chryseobacterium defluvii TaxID=160396 RepID=A0A840KD53_9FLAO|nr:LexA family transcriptional regulator [Chryseobacterium defluvii]MBB4807429.1 transcriptional regulator with XRE-family HTH domain [Chryseobacterium defluvii]